MFEDNLIRIGMNILYIGVIIFDQFLVQLCIFENLLHILFFFKSIPNMKKKEEILIWKKMILDFFFMIS